MSSIRRMVGGLLVVAAALAAAAAVARPTEQPVSGPALSETEVLELDIAFYRRRTAHRLLGGAGDRGRRGERRGDHEQSAHHAAYR